ncbi:class I SAM-dependent methyltransferase [Nocardioides abyssi]|uniref:Class I SAM-dependent methyltransferase n=1 Tax=Nocardioides abyssi TaxID=3058370 RepID=A0ABT8EU68_9ACTN|nr:class I SAM-dependent methyltransferase [Nocardioides abyssi]MDN4161715.1 class I SAM-dependent methyltransferase [Nocardioides abyssi]
MSAVLTGHRSRVRDLRHRLGRRVHDGVAAGTKAVGQAPMPPTLRKALSVAVWHQGTARIALPKVLVGGQNGLPASVIAEATGDLLWGSRSIADGPHVALLRAGAQRPLTDEEILASAYADLARACIAVSGQYFGVTDEAGILRLSRDFLARAAAPVGMTLPQAGPVRPHQSEPGVPILLAPVRDSDCYQVVDGHHRLAIQVVQGSVGVRAKVRRLSVTTPLQDVLDEMSWIGGERELYQPVDAPEVRHGYRVVRRCTDRLAMMAPLLEEVAAEVDRPSYLDVAACYGWFVDAVGRAGYDAEGVERDPAAPRVAAALHGTDPTRIHVADAVDFLAGDRTWDVVSCFSLLHHFVLGRGPCPPEELVRLLDRATGRVLFLDTGQAHERWFRDSLPEWDAEHVRSFLAEHTTFDRIIDLGTDSDAVAPYEENYGRHLFACVRDR